MTEVVMPPNQEKFRRSSPLRLLQVLLGVALILLFFVPFGTYHSTAEPYVSGVLWGFDLPIGYAAFCLGLLLILYPRIKPLQKRFAAASFVVLVGFLVLAFVWLSPAAYFVNLLNGTALTDSQVDLDYVLAYGASFWIGVASVAFGLLTRFLPAPHQPRVNTEN